MPLHRRLPKRGFHHGKRHPLTGVNVDALDRVFENGTNVTVETVVEAGLADPTKGLVKVLGRGEVSKQLNLTVHVISPGARRKIEAAGGTVTLLPTPKTGKKAAKAKKSTSASGEGR